MDKKLPSIFKNDLNKKIDNNKKVFYSRHEAVGNVIEKSSEVINNAIDTGNTAESRSLSESLDSLLKNNQFIFNVPVEISLKEGTINTKLISKVGNNLLTNTGETIKLEDILLIRIKDM